MVVISFACFFFFFKLGCLLLLSYGSSYIFWIAGPRKIHDLHIISPMVAFLFLSFLSFVPFFPFLSFLPSLSFFPSLPFLSSFLSFLPSLSSFLPFFQGLHPWHMDIPKLGVKSDLELPAYATATAMPDSSRICELHHSSWQCQIFNPLSEARDWTLSHDGNSAFHFLDRVFWCKKVFNFDKY